MHCSALFTYHTTYHHYDIFCLGQSNRLLWQGESLENAKINKRKTGILCVGQTAGNKQDTSNYKVNK